MKKIISLIAAVAMFATMSITSFAATATVALNSETVSVADGTQDVTLDVTVTLSEETVIGIVTLPFELPDGVTMTAYDASAFAAFCDDMADDSDTEVAIISLMDDDDMEATVSGSFVIPVTFTVDTSAATVYDIALVAGDTIIGDVDMEPINDADNPPTATITVAAPAPSKTDVVIAAPVVEESAEANGVYNAGFLADFTVDADANNPVKTVKFTVNNGEKDAEIAVDLGTTVEAGTVKVALNILNVATGVELTTTVAPVAE